MVCITLAVCTASVAAPAQTFTILHSFESSDGEVPGELIQASDGNFYGTTSSGGAQCKSTAGCGTVFQITAGGALTTLYNFCTQTGCPDGINPSSLTQATDGNFYGTTFKGGNHNGGTVFKITSAGTLTTLYNFCAQTGCPDGENPSSLMQATDGNFYGTTHEGGASNNCVAGCGTVFKITPEGMLATLHSFENSDGINPDPGLIQATDGSFYGVTRFGPDSDRGTVFRITPAGTLTTLHTFPLGSAGGWYPSGLIQATDGNFFGTTYGGGASGVGTVFKITAAGTLTTLYSFCPQKKCPDGEHGWGGLIQGIDGNFYGTTSQGGGSTNCGFYGCGTLFEITPTGSLGVLHNFDSVGGSGPIAKLIQATDGSFYGTTPQGGGSNNCTSGCGTVFRLAAVPAVTFVPASLSFGLQVLTTTSAAKTVTLKNTGTALLIMRGVTVAGNGFAISANTCGDILAPGKTCNVSVTFTPPLLGKLIGTLTFNDNVSNSSQKVSLLGRGVEPATLTPAAANYVAQALGTTSAAHTFTLTNNQTAMLTGIAIAASGDFALSATTCTTSLAAKSKCTISVTFTPTVLGKRIGRLSVSDSASNNPQTSNLSGTGK